MINVNLVKRYSEKIRVPFLSIYTDKSGVISDICVLCKRKILIYTLGVSTGNNPIRHRQLNTMISLDVRNSYALRRAADAPGSVRQTQRR